MKLLIIIAVVAVVAVAGFGLAKPDLNSSDATINSATTAESIESSTGKNSNSTSPEIGTIDAIIAKIKDLLNLAQTEEAQEIYRSLEEEASVFVDKTLTEIKKKIPEDLAVEVSDFNVEKIENAKLESIKAQCASNSKYNSEKITAGFDVKGEIKITSKQKDYIIDVSLVVIKEGDEWKTYDIQYSFPEGLGLSDFFVND